MTAVSMGRLTALQQVQQFQCDIDGAVYSARLFAVVGVRTRLVIIRHTLHARSTAL